MPLNQTKPNPNNERLNRAFLTDYEGDDRDGETKIHFIISRKYVYRLLPCLLLKK